MAAKSTSRWLLRISCVVIVGALAADIGGYVVSDEELQRMQARGPEAAAGDVPYPFSRATEML